MTLALTIPIGVVVSCETVEHSWPATRWRVAEVLLDPPSGADWRKLTRTSDAPRYHAATLPLCLVAKDAASYQVNISNGVPTVYVVARDSSLPSSMPLSLRFVSVSPFEAQSLAASGLDHVESIPMPDRLLKIVSEFVEQARSREAKVSATRYWSEIPSLGAAQSAK